MQAQASKSTMTERSYTATCVKFLGGGGGRINLTFSHGFPQLGILQVPTPAYLRDSRPGRATLKYCSSAPRFRSSRQIHEPSHSFVRARSLIRPAKEQLPPAHRNSPSDAWKIPVLPRCKMENAELVTFSVSTVSTWMPFGNLW